MNNVLLLCQGIQDLQNGGKEKKNLKIKKSYSYVTQMSSYPEVNNLKVIY